MRLTTPAHAEAAATTWRAHPARERPVAAAVGGAAVAAVVLAVYLCSLSWAVTLLAAVWMVVQMRHFFLPSRFAIDPDGITARDALGRKRYRWREVRRFVADRHGAYLSTRERQSWLDPWRGMHVLFGQRRDEIRAAIRDAIERGGGPWAG